MSDLQVVAARVEDAAEIADLVHRSFAARPALDPPAPALSEDAESVAAAITESGGLVARIDGNVVGTLLFDDSRPHPAGLGLRRVAVDPGCQSSGIASAMVTRVEQIAEERGQDRVWLRVREELPDTVRFWLQRGYERAGTDGVHTVVVKLLSVSGVVDSAAAMRKLAARLAPLLAAGDVLILSGELGAGKTTFVQGLAEALGVRGPVTSPTFVLSRIHPSMVDGPDLVHVDAYRLGSSAEVDDLDLDATVANSVTVVEWGRGRAEQLADSWLDVSIETDDPTVNEPARLVSITPRGTRGSASALRSAFRG